MVRKILFIFAFILLLSISFSQTYLITKENLEKIFKEIKKEILSIQSYNFKCYFNRICVFDKPIKGFESFFIENKPIFKIQRLESLSILDVYRVWNTSFENLNLTGSNVKIAILDTGIDIKHKDLNYSLDSWKCFYSIDNKVIEGNWSYCNDDNGHGTHVAGIIAARYDGNISKCFEGYVCGAAPNATLFIAKVLDSEGYGTLIDILNALEWAVNNSVDIISMSFGADLSSLGFSSCYPYGSNDADIIRTFDDIMDYIAEKYNIVLIAAAGNNHNSFSSPACAKNVIAVGAIDKNKNLAYFSSRGPIDGRIKPDIVAPGVLISSTFPTNTYRTLSGTSMATPFISGIAALLLEAFKKESINYTSQEIKALVLTSPNELDRNNSFGSGIVNATELIRIRKNYLTSRVYYNETTLFIINASKNNFKITIYRNEFNKSNFANIFLFDSQGNLVKYFSTSDNVIQIKGITAGKYYLLANFVNISNITFAFSEKICEPFNFTCLNNLESFVAGPLLNIVVEEPIEYKINSTHINFSISIKDFLGNFISTPLIVNVTIRNSTNHIVFNKAFSSSKINFVFSPASFDVYSLLIQALSENKWGMIEKSYLFLPYEILTPKNILKLMNGDYLNVTLKLPDNFNISNASIYLPEKPGSIQILSFKNISNIWFNFTRISLNIPGIYYLYLNITSGLNSYNVTFPIFEFNNTFSYLIDFPSKSFAYRSINITFKLYHFNGTELNIDRKICLKNESLNIVCINSSSSNFTLSLNVSFSGIYNLSFLANDTFGNYLVLNKSILISLLPDKLIIEKSKNIFTIFEPLNVSVLAINSSGNQICLICDIYVNISYISGTKSSTVLWNVSSHSIINNIIPPTPNGTYNITFYTKINPLIINSTTVDIITANISTNVSQRVFPNNINISINISIDRLSNVSIEIAKINISGIYSLKPLEDFSATYGCQINSIQGNFLWCNVTNGINLVLNTSETSTYIINITSFNDTANGFL
ncbi:MAG: S8 family peptidase, partial [Candidatus Aenigmatarchaeota archaeon]